MTGLARDEMTLRERFDLWLETVGAAELTAGMGRALDPSLRTGDAYLPPHEPDFVTKKYTHEIAIGSWPQRADGRQMSWCGFYVAGELLATDGALPTCPECLARRQALNQW